jgi:hypothetical protein
VHGARRKVHGGSRKKDTAAVAAGFRRRFSKLWRDTRLRRRLRRGKSWRGKRWRAEGRQKKIRVQGSAFTVQRKKEYSRPRA